MNTIRIGFISTRFAGTDGVSLETAKWVTVLKGLGHRCCFFSGESEWPAADSYVVPEAHFRHPEIQALNIALFERHNRFPDTSAQVGRLAAYLKDHLYRFVRRFEPQVLIVENAVSLPMNIPLGLAISELIAETSIPAIAHHHDFAWERERYAVDAAANYLRAAFPPTMEQVQHVVINSYARRQLALHAGVSSTIIPNVMDFDNPLPGPDDYCRTLRSELGIRDGQYLLLQPTRIIPRKRIEKAIELARRLDLDCAVVISHDAGDEGQAYQAYLRDFAGLLDVDLVFAARRCAPQRGKSEDGARVFSLYDIYQAADLVTYPSQIEGFGNALLEAIYSRQPVITSTYRVLKTDIQPKGFRFIEFDDYFTNGFVEKVRDILLNPEESAEMVEHNYQVGKRFYSYTTLESHLVALLAELDIAVIKPVSHHPFPAQFTLPAASETVL